MSYAARGLSVQGDTAVVCDASAIAGERPDERLFVDQLSGIGETTQSDPPGVSLASLKGMWRSRTTALFLAVAALAVGLAAFPAETGPALVGRWQLNEKESEDPQAKFRPLAPGEDPRQRDREDQGRPDGARERPRRPGPSPSPGKLEAPPGLGEFIDPPRTLTITGNDTELTLDDGRGVLVRLSLDGSERPDGPLTRQARREGNSVVVDTKNSAGARLTTRYNLMAGQRKLEVYSRLAGKDGRAVTLRRVYDEAAQ